MATIEPNDVSLSPDPSAYIHQLRAKRHANNRDLKVVITQRDSETGGGKTTLAVWLAMCWDRHGWYGEEKGTTDPEKFLETFPDLPPHSVMILDEAEALDSRRAMAEENIEFSKKWMKMRTRQIDSILTLPTASALDVRILELADVRIHVTGPGECKVYRVTVDDRSRELDQRWKEFYTWPDVSEFAPYQNLDQKKQDDLDETADEDEEDDELTAKEIKGEIIDSGGLDRYIRDVNGGTQRVLDKGLIGAEYEISEAKSKRVKSLLMTEVDDGVM